MDISVIIPTYMRKNTLRLILQSLEKQTFSLSDMEVLAVDDGSTDGTCEMLANYRGPLNLSIHSTGLPEGEYGYLKALNVGIRSAKGTYLVFLDSDMVVKHDAIEKLIACHTQWEEKGDKVLIRAWWARRRSFFKLWLRGESLKNYQPHRAAQRSKKFRTLMETRESLTPKQATSAFLSIRKEWAVAVDGFAEHATSYGMDGEFQERLVEQLGVKIVFEPEVYAIHGPVRGDIRAKAYKNNVKVPMFRKMKRKGLLP